MYMRARARRGHVVHVFACTCRHTLAVEDRLAGILRADGDVLVDGQHLGPSGDALDQILIRIAGVDAWVKVRVRVEGEGESLWRERVEGEG